MSPITLAFASVTLLGTLRAQNTPPASGPDAGDPRNRSSELRTNGTAPSQTTPDSATLVVTRVVKAIYPLQAEQNKLEGQVTVKVAISETGDVESVEVVSGDPTLAQAATDAAKEWKFKPYIRNSKPVRASTKLTFNFVFRDQMPDEHSTIANNSLQRQVSPITDVTTVRVSERVAQQMVLQKVEPAYPGTAKTARIQGPVVIFAVIGKDGTIKSLRLIRGHPLLTQAALDAVKQGRFRPYILNGEPVEVQTTITVNFTFN